MSGWKDVSFKSIAGKARDALWTYSLTRLAKRGEHQPTTGRTYLSYAVLEGDFELVQALIPVMADINQRDKAPPRKKKADKESNVAVDVEGMRRGEEGSTALHAALRAVDGTAFPLLKFVRPNAPDDRAFMSCALGLNTRYVYAKYDARIVEALLTAGADVNAVDAKGRTPLFNAVRYGHFDIAHRLLDRGANIDHRDKRDRTVAWALPRPLLTEGKHGAEFDRQLVGLVKRGMRLDQVGYHLSDLKGRRKPGTTTDAVLGRLEEKTRIKILQDGCLVTQAVDEKMKVWMTPEGTATDLLHLALSFGYLPKLMTPENWRLPPDTAERFWAALSPLVRDADIRATLACHMALCMDAKFPEARRHFLLHADGSARPELHAMAALGVLGTLLDAAQWKGAEAVAASLWGALPEAARKPYHDLDLTWLHQAREAETGWGAQVKEARVLESRRR